MPSDHIIRRFSEKLQDLNETQPSIKSLSNWCISHRKHAKDMVETWHKEFQCVDGERKVPFLYLANDVVQKCKRQKLREFVDEFWDVLPPLMTEIHQNGDDKTKNSVLRLVDIWQERKTFVSKCSNVRDVMFGENRSYDDLIFPKDLKRKHGGQITSVEDDGATIKKNCKTESVTVQELELKTTETDDGNWVSMEEKELEEEESSLRDCVAQLKNSENTNKNFVSFIKETIMKEVSKLEEVSRTLKEARAQRENAKRLIKLLEERRSATVREANVSEVIRPQTPSLFLSSSTPFIKDEDDSKSAAAEVATKLMHTAGKEEIFKSILSSLAAGDPVSNPPQQIASPIPPNQAALGHQIQFLRNPNPSPNPNLIPVVENMQSPPTFPLPFPTSAYPSGFRPVDVNSNINPPLPPGPPPPKLPSVPFSSSGQYPHLG